MFFPLDLTWLVALGGSQSVRNFYGLMAIEQHLTLRKQLITMRYTTTAPTTATARLMTWALVSGMLLSACGLDESDTAMPTQPTDPEPPTNPEPPVPGFDIELQFHVSVSEEERRVLREAADMWESVITGDLPDVITISTDCLATGPAQIDDLVVYVESRVLGGPIAAAGPTCLRRSYLPATGRIILASDHTHSSTHALRQTALHELGHVLGFGILWRVTDLGLLHDPSCTFDPVADMWNCDTTGTIDTRYVGLRGNASWQTLGHNPLFPVPVENRLGLGSSDGHWREDSVLHAELMSPVLRADVREPLSKVTVGAMEDLGYVVDYGAAEPFTPTEPPATLAQKSTGPSHGDMLLGPIHFVDASGRLTPIWP